MSSEHEYVLRQAAGELDMIAAIWPQLRARLEPSGQASEVHTAPTSKPPINLYVSDLLYEVEQEARSLAHVLMDETDWLPKTSAMPGLLEEVALRYGHWVGKTEQEIYAYTDWAHDTYNKAAKALEAPPNPRFIGICPVPECGGDLYVNPDNQHGGWAAYGRCRTCYGTVPVAEQIAYIKRLSLDWLLPRRDLVDALQIWGINVKPNTITKWVSRGKLIARGGMYKVSDAIEIATPTTRRKAS